MIYTALFYLGPAASFISPPMFISVTLLQPDYFPTRRASSCLGVFVLALISAWRACSWISAWLNPSLPSCLCSNVTYSKALSDQPIVPSPKSSSTLTLSIHFFHAMIIMWYASWLFFFYCPSSPTKIQWKLHESRAFHLYSVIFPQDKYSSWHVSRSVRVCNFTLLES